MRELKIGIITLLLTMMVLGCATSEIIPMGTNSYMISQTSAGGVFKSMSSLKSGVIKRANAFAESKGKIAIPIASKESPAYPGHMPNFEYQFRLVSKDDPRATGGALVPRADVVIENKTELRGEKIAPEKKDIYTQLIKLDDLRKKKIITAEEFLQQKEKLLSDG
tara:strand:+ start:599 stop:1093 length:495 start_codon:yes stop_codon:yes gene_type:complete